MSKVYVYNAWNAAFNKSCLDKQGRIIDLNPGQTAELAPAVYEQTRTKEWIKAGRLKQLNDLSNIPQPKPQFTPEPEEEVDPQETLQESPEQPEELPQPTFDPNAGAIEPRTEGDAVVLEQKTEPEAPAKKAIPPETLQLGDSVVSVAPIPEPEKEADKGSPVKTGVVTAGDSCVVVISDVIAELPTPIKKEEPPPQVAAIYQKMIEQRIWVNKVKFIKTIDNKEALQYIINNTRTGTVNTAAKDRLEALSS
jgi:hypothetical protein